jgi:hypothetical protein
MRISPTKNQNTGIAHSKNCNQKEEGEIAECSALRACVKDKICEIKRKVGEKSQEALPFPSARPENSPINSKARYLTKENLRRLPCLTPQLNIPRSMIPTIS